MDPVEPNTSMAAAASSEESINIFTDEDSNEGGSKEKLNPNRSDGANESLQLVPDDLVKEEAKVKAENEEMEAKDEAERHPEHDDLSKAKRYKMLMNLLGQSQLYSEYLKDKMEKDDEAAALKKKRVKERKELKESIGKRKREDSGSSSGIRCKRLKFDVVREINGEKISDEQPFMLTGGVMRDYQIAGFQWITTLFENDINGILADEMGLGKTIQTIALFCHLVEMGVAGPFLIVAPLSTLSNWMNEFKKFAPVFPTVLYHGSKAKREELRAKLKENSFIENINKKVKNVFITSYEIAMNDRAHLCNVKWRYIVVDEGHRLKNMDCRLIKELKRYRAVNKLLLTGTPLQNNLAELWSLLNFIMPEIFDDLTVFESWFDPKEIDMNKDAKERIVNQEKQNNILTILHRILTPFLLRRVKADVDLDIPPKKEILVYCPMSMKQREFYEATVNKTIVDLVKTEDENPKIESNEKSGRSMRKTNPINYKMFFDDSNNEKKMNQHLKTLTDYYKNKQNKATSAYNATRSTKEINISLKNRMMDLRKTTNHPYLIEYPLTDDGMHYRTDQDIVDICGKMKILDQMLDELFMRNHKILLFSQMTRMLTILEDYLGFKGIEYSRLDGSMSYEDRQKNIDTFNEDPRVQIFLLSTRAGGLGINLVAADTCIIYDSDWNPQQDLQAQDRCHRIGQKKPVVVFRLVTANTIDQQIVERAAAKRKLEKMIIHSKKFKSNDSAGLKKTMEKISPQELLDLLNSRDHASVIDWKEGAVLTKSELNALLDRSDMMGAKTAAITESKEVDDFFKVVDNDNGNHALASVSES